MKPTNELRFVERGLTRDILSEDGSVLIKDSKVTVMVLQQKWVPDPWKEGDPIGAEWEWRDVPIEKETI